MQFDPRYFNTTLLTGVQSGGHNTISGDPGGDLYVSPSDTVSYWHHAQIDHVWSVWQNLDLEKRERAIWETGTFQDVPPSANVTLRDEVSIGVLGEGKRMGELTSTVKRPLCYVYV
jgi:tyrosinase